MSLFLHKQMTIFFTFDKRTIFHKKKTTSILESRIKNTLNVEKYFWPFFASTNWDHNQPSKVNNIPFMEDFFIILTESVNRHDDRY